MEAHLENGKFYVPQIEEFYVGFECELMVHELKDWEKHTVTPKDSLDIQKYIDGGHVRVKHLDREDIELEGWIDNDDLAKTYGGETKGRLYHKIIEHRGDKCEAHLFHVPSSNHILIGVQSYTFEKRIDDGKDVYEIRSGTLFTGTIKNKSELKKLLKQLGI